MRARVAAAAQALGERGGEAAARLLASHGLVDREPQVRLRPAQGLWLSRGVGARPRLLAAARVEPDREVRAGIERLLGQVPGGRATAPRRPGARR